MLVKPTIHEAEKYIGFAYELALNPARSGYPTYSDGIKTREDFVSFFQNSFHDPRRGNFMYVENGEVRGWIQYIFLEEDAYLQTEIFNISGDVRQALSEFVVYCEKHYKGYSLYLGFPSANAEAISYLTESGWTCIERSFNDILFFEGYKIRPVHADIRKVTRQNFEDFYRLHAPIEGKMYWNCERLYAELENWEIYLYYRENLPVGAIYYTDEEVLVEIFGVDFPDDAFDEDVFRGLLIKVLNDCKESGKKYMVFFNGETSQKSVLDLGFTCVGQYVLHIRQV